MMQNWNSPIYAFFKPFPAIEYKKGRCCHVFKCSAASCKGKGHDPCLVHHYLDTQDCSSTGNLCKHARGCWGDKVIQKADSVGDLHEVRNEVKKSWGQQDGLITMMFSRIKGKGKVTYSHRQHTTAKARWCFSSLNLSHPLGSQRPLATHHPYPWEPRPSGMDWVSEGYGVE